MANFGPLAPKSPIFPVFLADPVEKGRFLRSKWPAGPQKPHVFRSFWQALSKKAVFYDRVGHLEAKEGDRSNPAGEGDEGGGFETVFKGGGGSHPR